MKPLAKLIVSKLQKPSDASAGESRSGKIQISLVSEKERDLYRVPSYGYLLP